MSRYPILEFDEFNPRLISSVYRRYSKKQYHKRLIGSIDRDSSKAFYSTRGIFADLTSKELREIADQVDAHNKIMEQNERERKEREE
jgi:hypothetical protein